MIKCSQRTLSDAFGGSMTCYQPPIRHLGLKFNRHISLSIYILDIYFREAAGAWRDTVITHGHTDAKRQKWELK